MTETTPNQYSGMSVEQIDSQISNLEGALGYRSEPAKPEAKAPPLEDQMSRIYDSIEKREAKEAKASPEMPLIEGESTEDTARRAYEWTEELSKAERARQANAISFDAALKDEAKRRGLSVNELAQIKGYEAIDDNTRMNEKTLKQVTDFRNTFDPVKAHYGSMNPVEISRSCVELDALVRQNPVAGFSEMARRLGYDPRQLGHALAGQHAAPSAAEIGMSQAMQRFFKDHPEAEQYRYEMSGALNRSEVAEGADDYEMLVKAYKIARGDKASHSKERRRERSERAAMEQIYNRNMKGRG